MLFSRHSVATMLLASRASRLDLPALSSQVRLSRRTCGRSKALQLARKVLSLLPRSRRETLSSSTTAMLSSRRKPVNPSCNILCLCLSGYVKAGPNTLKIKKIYHEIDLTGRKFIHVSRSCSPPFIHDFLYRIIFKSKHIYIGSIDDITGPEEGHGNRFFVPSAKVSDWPFHRHSMNQFACSYIHDLDRLR